MMALTKLVNGKRITLTAEEEDSIRAEWEANRNKPVVDTTEEEIDADPMKKVTLQLLIQATGKTKQEIIDMIKLEKSIKETS
jgi:hypothetical protein